MVTETLIPLYDSSLAFTWKSVVASDFIKPAIYWFLYLKLDKMKLWILLLAVAVSTEETPGQNSCVERYPGIPGNPGHNGIPGRDGRDGPKGEKGDTGIVLFYCNELYVQQCFWSMHKNISSILQSLSEAVTVNQQPDSWLLKFVPNS